MTPETASTVPSLANWRKAGYSTDQTACVEVADWATGAAVRDTRNRGLGHLTYPTAEWTGLLHTLRNT